ncbi:kinase-like domain, phloem protein 2-like protein [Tanacetum coccineum]
MEHGFLIKKGSGRGRGIKEKDVNASNIGALMDDAIPSVTVVARNTQEENVPHVVDMTVKKDKLSSLEDTTVLGSFLPLPMQVTTSASNAPRKSSYDNVTSKPSGKKVNVLTLFTPGGNRIDVLVPVDFIRAISEQFANTAYGFFLGKNVAYLVVANYNNPLILKKWHPDENLLKEDVSTIPVWVKLHGVPVTAFSEDGLSAIATKLGTPLLFNSYTSDMCMQSWGWSSYARVMIELRADVELKDNIVVAMPRITREGHYTCNVHVEYEWKPPRCSSCKVFGHIYEECPKNIGFKPQKEYRPVSKNSTASSSGNKKKGKLRLFDDDGNPLVPTGIVESDSEVEVVFDETANLRISTSGKDGSDKGYGTNILLE